MTIPFPSEVRIKGLMADLNASTSYEKAAKTWEGNFLFIIEPGGSQDDAGIPMTQRHEDGGKAHIIARHHHWRSACNNMGVCYFAVMPAQTYVDLLQAATGLDWELVDIIQAGERSWNLKRLYNLRPGWKRSAEKLSNLLRQPLLDGGQMGHVPDEELMLREY